MAKLPKKYGVRATMREEGNEPSGEKRHSKTANTTRDNINHNLRIMRDKKKLLTLKQNTIKNNIKTKRRRNIE